MFGGLDDRKLEFLWLDGKRHSVQILEGDEPIDLKELQKSYQKMSEDKEEACKDIQYLGLGLTGNPSAAKGFMLGWLVKSIKDSFEKKRKLKWKINHEVTEISEEEARTYLAGELRNLADKIENDDEYKVKKAPILRGDVDGTELFE